MRSDSPAIPDEAIMLAEARRIVARDLSESFHAMLLSVHDATIPARAEAVLTALHRVLMLPHLQAPLMYVAGIRVAPELLRALHSDRLPSRSVYELEQGLSPFRFLLERALVDRVRGCLVGHDLLGVAEQADALADEVLAGLQLPSVQRVVCFLTGHRTCAALLGSVKLGGAA